MLSKRLRRYITCFICACLIICFQSTTSYAESDDQAMQVGNDLLSMLKSKGELIDPVDLYNIDKIKVAVCYQINTGGYLIVNTIDYTIPEFSLKAQSPYHKSIRNDNSILVYNGPLAYYTLSNDTINDINSDESYNVSEIMNMITVDSKISKQNETIYKSVTSSVSVTKTLPYKPRTWKTGFCGVVVSSIMLMYYQDHLPGTFVQAGNGTESRLPKYLVDNKYLCNNGMTANTVVNGINDANNQTTGLVDYFKDNVYNTTVKPKYKNSYSYSFVKSKINAKRPIVVGTTSSTSPNPHPTYPNHYVTVMGYSYVEAEPDIQYLIVNNSWGDNDVYITAAAKYYVYMIYFE